MLALAREDSSFMTDALRKLGKSYNDILKAVQAVRETSGPANTRAAENLYDALNKYGIDLTERASQGKLIITFHFHQRKNTWMKLLKIYVPHKGNWIL